MRDLFVLMAIYVFGLLVTAVVCYYYCFYAAFIIVSWLLIVGVVVVPFWVIKRGIFCLFLEIFTVIFGRKHI